MEVEEEHVPISSHGTRPRQNALVTGSVGRSMRRGSTHIRSRRGRGGEVSPTGEREGELSTLPHPSVDKRDSS